MSRVYNFDFMSTMWQPQDGVGRYNLLTTTRSVPSYDVMFLEDKMMMMIRTLRVCDKRSNDK